ncbi:MAG TPA: ATP-binding cassette domain-containing protein, partial [Candidatus Eisenbacteria bacterium]|nr:ATP-binding cassette domain-containing protein [Candidatus Eisenbacteria bacterium]
CGVWVPPEDRGVGLVFQDLRLFPHLTVRQNLRFARTRQPGAQFDVVVDLLGLRPLLERSVQGLSGGESRLVAIGRALLSHPRILLLDEPLTGLDPVLRQRVLAHLLRLKERLDVRLVLVSHVFSDLLALADRMAVLERGRLLTTGTPTHLIAHAFRGGVGERLESILTGHVVALEEGLARVAVGGTEMEAHVPGGRVGDSVLLAIGAQDVLVGIGEPPRTSARNVLLGQIEAMEHVEDIVLLSVHAGAVIWAEVTRNAVRELGLEPGRAVYALIKASAIRATVA